MTSVAARNTNDSPSTSKSASNKGSGRGKINSNNGGAANDAAGQRPNYTKGQRKKSQSNASSREGSDVAGTSETMDLKGESDTGSLHMHDRLLYLLIHLVGKRVELTLKNGAKFEGNFVTSSTEGDIGVVLSDCKLVRPAPGEDDSKSGSSTEGSIIFEPKDVVEIFAKRVNLGSMDKTDFKTDSQISASSGPRERVLERWQPSADEDPAGALLGLEDDRSKQGNKWDQFEANERMFGIKSEFKEELYTTKLDRSHSEFKEREEAAARLAREIEANTSGNAHMREERGIVDDSGLNEEEKYSGVQRTTPSGGRREGNRYLAPALRAPSGVSTVSGAPFDPAIISSQLSNPEALRKGEEKDKANLSRIKGAQEIEKEFIGSFKQFVSGERERLQQKKQAHLKKEKDGRLQELMKFSQSFKLHTPVPEDLVPILARDKNKVDDMGQKGALSSAGPSQMTAKDAYSGENAQPTLAQRLANVREGNGSSSQLPSPTPISPEPASSKASLRFNVKAMEFKPNPGATNFSSVHSPRVSGATLPSSQSPLQLSRPSSPSVFFGNRKPKGDRPKISDSFNPFQRAKRENPSIKETELEKPYTFAPTWPAGDDNADKSYAMLAGTPKVDISSPQSLPSESSMDSQLRQNVNPVLVQSPQMPNAAPFNPMYAQPQFMYGMPGAPMAMNAYRQPYAQGFVPSNSLVGQQMQMPYLAGSGFMPLPMGSPGMNAPQGQMYPMQTQPGYSPGQGTPMMMQPPGGSPNQQYMAQNFAHQNGMVTLERTLTL